MNDSRKVILLVEDNPSDTGLTQRAFEKAGVADNLIVAEDGQEALDYLWGGGAYVGRDVSDLPALVLLDLGLPKVPGLEVLRHIRRHARTRILPVVILTTSQEQADIAAAYDLGVDGYIRKPIAFEQFTLAIEQLGCYWLQLDQLSPKVR